MNCTDAYIGEEYVTYTYIFIQVVKRALYITEISVVVASTFMLSITIRKPCRNCAITTLRKLAFLY